MTLGGAELIGLTLKCQLKEVPLLSHRPTTPTPNEQPSLVASLYIDWDCYFKRRFLRRHFSSRHQWVAHAY